MNYGLLQPNYPRPSIHQRSGWNTHSLSYPENTQRSRGRYLDIVPLVQDAEQVAADAVEAIKKSVVIKSSAFSRPVGIPVSFSELTAWPQPIKGLVPSAS